MKTSLKIYEITFVYVVPVFLFFVGMLVLPFGIVFWFGALLFCGIAKAHVKSQLEIKK